VTEMQDGFTLVRSLIDQLESRADREPEFVRARLIKLTAVLRADDRPRARAGAKPRGLGYTFDEALIVAFRHEHGGSIEEAARAHWAGEDEDQVDANIRTLYRHKKEIEDVGEGGDY
jgi:hypothetical protein